MSYGPVAVLCSAGHPIDVLSDGQRGVRASLPEEEVATLNSVKTRMDAAGAGEVEGQHVFIIR